jgi:hypothetical protein
MLLAPLYRGSRRADLEDAWFSMGRKRSILLS